MTVADLRWARANSRCNDCGQVHHCFAQCPAIAMETRKGGDEVQDDSAGQGQRPEGAA